jgi:dienelactone hydrolase
MKHIKTALVFMALTLIALAIGLSFDYTFESGTLVEAKRGFVTKLQTQRVASEPVKPPPPEVFSVVQYPAAKGAFPAYLTPPTDNQKRPAIIWLTGGDSNTIGDCWTAASADNDQTAAAYRQAGIVMMFPSLRGGNQNAGPAEGFLGEVDDVIAAADFLAKQPHVDPARIYLGGHSTGGTLAMLVAASTNRFRAVFAFGPVADVRSYQGNYTYNVDALKEWQLREPVRWLHAIQSPTFVIEGMRGNVSEISKFRRVNKNHQAKFYIALSNDHFDVLSPANKLLAQKILADSGATSNITLSEGELVFKRVGV